MLKGGKGWKLKEMFTQLGNFDERPSLDSYNTILATTVVLSLKSEKRKLDMCGLDLFDV